MLVGRPPMARRVLFSTLLALVLCSSSAVRLTSRRAHLQAAACAALFAPLPAPAHPKPTREAAVTDRVALTFSEQFSPEEKRE
eukprot:scaffold134902_cov31-Tisochrysis_lutea.AAC.2